MYFTFYDNTTGKMIISRRMSQAQADARIAQHSNQSYLNAYVSNLDDKKVNLDTLEVETIQKPNTVIPWFRNRRNLLLMESDWTQGADSPLTDAKKAEWATYRQALRDLPTSYSNPTSKDSITWPTKPE